MADTIWAKNDIKPFPKHPAGTFGAVCVDVIDLGENVETFSGKPPKLSHKIVIVFQTGEKNPDTGAAFELPKELTLSMFETAGLRKFLGLWRGRTYTDEEADEGAPLHKLEGVNATLTVEHKNSASKAGKTYANILNISPWPKGMEKRVVSDYTRAEFWTKKKTEYAAAAAAFRASNAPQQQRAQAAGADFNDFPGALEDDEDDLPFN